MPIPQGSLVPTADRQTPPLIPQLGPFQWGWSFSFTVVVFLRIIGDIWAFPTHLSIGPHLSVLRYILLSACPPPFVLLVGEPQVLTSH